MKPNTLARITLSGAILFAASTAWSLQLWNTSYDLPQNVQNGIVKIHTQDGFFGTGTIVGVRYDNPSDQNAGAWIAVLTADHVLLNEAGDGLDAPFDIGFKNDTATYEYTTSASIRGPLNGDNTRVDLAMLGFKVANYNTFLTQLRFNGAGLKLPDLGTVGASTTLELAGYGKTNVTPVTDQKYKLLNQLGTLRAATAIVDQVGVERTITFGPNNYKFQAITGNLRFTLNGDGTVATGSAYTQDGDSGGPTYFSNGGNYSLVGVHSSSTEPDTDGFNFPGDTWRDVYVSQYSTWVQQSIAAVPEPPVWLALGLALIAVSRRRKRKLQALDQGSTIMGVPRQQVA